MSYVRRSCRTQSNRRRTFRQNPHVTHSVDSVTKMMHLVKCVLHDSLTGVNESSQKDKLVSELGVGPYTEEQLFLEPTNTNALEGFIGTIAVGGIGHHLTSTSLHDPNRGLHSYISNEPIDLPRIEKSKDMVTTRKGVNTAQDIRLNGKTLDDMKNFQHIGSNRIKRLQHN